MTFNHLKTNRTKLAHYILKIRKVIEFFDFQSLMQHPLYNKKSRRYLTMHTLYGVNKLTLNSPDTFIKFICFFKNFVFKKSYFCCRRAEFGKCFVSDSYSISLKIQSGVIVYYSLFNLTVFDATGMKLYEDLPLRALLKSKVRK